MVEIPVEIATFQNHQFRSLVRVLDHLVTTTVTTIFSTKVILAVIKLLVTTTRVTAILVTAMLCQVKNIVFITRMLKCQCSTCQNSFLLVLSWAVIAKVILVCKNYSVYLYYNIMKYFSKYTFWERNLIVVTNLLNIFLRKCMYFINLKYTYNNIESSAIVIDGFLDSTKL